MYTYIHDATKSVVYMFPAPVVEEETDKRGRVTGWKISLDIRLTRSDNRLQAGTWLHPTGHNPRQSFDASHYSRDLL